MCCSPQPAVATADTTTHTISYMHQVIAEPPSLFLALPPSLLPSFPLSQALTHPPSPLPSPLQDAAHHSNSSSSGSFTGRCFTLRWAQHMLCGSCASSGAQWREEEADCHILVQVKQLRGMPHSVLATDCLWLCPSAAWHCSYAGCRFQQCTLAHGHKHRLCFLVTDALHHAVLMYPCSCIV
jgi:hypothetical protein